MKETSIEIGPRIICEDVPHDVNKNMSNDNTYNESSSKDDLQARQDDVEYVIKDVSNY